MQLMRTCGPVVLPAARPTATRPTASGVPTENLRSSLHGRGQRLTPQRQRVLALFETIGEGRHLSSEEVHQELASSKERISLATVYRTLRLLSSMGLLLELELPEGGRRYELAGDAHRDHHHLVCVGCGRTEEFESLPVLQAGGDAAERLGFQLLDCVLNVRALCPNCRAVQEISSQA
jgi:Fur family ferric uptake transcriptional regulator